MKAIGLGKISLTDMKSPKTVFNALTARDKHSFRNRDNLMQPIQMRVSQKQETFSEFFFAFLKSTLNFKGARSSLTFRQL